MLSQNPRDGQCQTLLQVLSTTPIGGATDSPMSWFALPIVPCLTSDLSMLTHNRRHNSVLYCGLHTHTHTHTNSWVSVGWCVVSIHPASKHFWQVSKEWFLMGFSMREDTHTPYTTSWSDNRVSSVRGSFSSGAIRAVTGGNSCPTAIAIYNDCPLLEWPCKMHILHLILPQSLILVLFYFVFLV